MCFFFNDTATTEIYTLSLHDALPILLQQRGLALGRRAQDAQVAARHPVARELGDRPDDLALGLVVVARARAQLAARSEEHTSELQSRQYLVCRLLLEKKKHTPNTHNR